MVFVGVNYWAILIAAVAAWILGAVWYTVFSKPWLAAVRKTTGEIERRRGGASFYAPFVLTFLANLVMAWVLAGLIGHIPPVGVRNGIISGAFVWLGFVITTMGVNNAFAMRKPLLTAIDGGHWLAVLLLMGATIGWMGVR